MIVDRKEIEDEFNTFFKDIGLTLVSGIPNSSKPFESFMKEVDATMIAHCLSLS